MSLTKNDAIRCDGCGKLSRNPLGEYTKPDGTAGYIVPIDPQQLNDLDFCYECANGHCPECGSKRIVRLTPGVPGPTGWGGRCKDCKHQWSLTTRDDSDPGPTT